MDLVFNFQYSIGDAGVCGSEHRVDVFQYSIGDAKQHVRLLGGIILAVPFNTLLEMPALKTLIENAYVYFQYSIGDARPQLPTAPAATCTSFNTLLEMHGPHVHRAVYRTSRDLSILYWRCHNAVGADNGVPYANLSILYLRCWGFLRLVFLGF